MIHNLSDFEEHFLRLARRGQEQPALVIEVQQLQQLFTSFEIKHNSKVMVIPKLEASPPYISCIVTSEETRRRLEQINQEQKQQKNQDELKQEKEQEQIKPTEPGMEPLVKI